VRVKRIEGTATHHDTQLSGLESISLFQDVSDHISFDSHSSNDAASKYIQTLFLPGKAMAIDEKLWLNMVFDLNNSLNSREKLRAMNDSLPISTLNFAVSWMDTTPGWCQAV
jgi:hypothetical protein